MPVYNVTGVAPVDDSSPMVMYSQGWTDNALDSQLSSYFDSTFHSTNSSGATATFSFFGTAVYLFGAMRPGYGPFFITLDGKDTSSSAATSGSASFQQLLFSQTDLTNGDHTLKLSNSGTGSSVDLDFITFTTGDGNSSTTLGDSKTDDTSTSIVYEPSNPAWGTVGFKQPSYFNSSLHVSYHTGDQAIFSFTGDAVSIFGATSGNHGTFSVKIDDRPLASLNGTSPRFRPQTLLYWAGGLGTGQHNMILTNTDRSNPQLDVDLDYYVASTWTAPALSPAPTHEASPAPIHTSTSKTPIIAGVISGMCVAIALAAGLFLFLRRRRRRRFRQMAEQDEVKPLPFILPPDPAVIQGTPGEYSFGKRSSKAPLSQFQPVAAASTSTFSTRTHIPTRSTDSVGNAASASSPVGVSPNAAPQENVSFNARVSSSALAPGVSQSQTRSVPSESLARPSNPHPSLSAAELSAIRMTVPNRPQDWGPIHVSAEEDDGHEGFPPDYQQATQPMPPATYASDRGEAREV